MTYGLEVFSEDTAIIQRDGADILNITVAAIGDEVPEVTVAEFEMLIGVISDALGRLA